MPWNRFDEPLAPGSVPERATQTPHGGVQSVLEIDERAVRPETLPQLAARDDLAGPFQQHREDRERLTLEPKPHAILPKLSCGDVQRESPEPESSS
jgi:hypothetical protein